MTPYHAYYPCCRYHGVRHLNFRSRHDRLWANFRKRSEWANKHGWDNFLIHWTENLRWERLRELWWVWFVFGFAGGLALALWLTTFVPLSQLAQPDDLPTGIRDHYHGSTTFKGLAGMSWGLASPAPIYLYSDADNIHATDFFARGINVSDHEIRLKDVFIQSGMTGKRLPMLINVNNHWIPIAGVNPIPSHAEFDLKAPLDGDKGVPMTIFLKEWGTFAFVAQYGDSEYRQAFDETAVAARFAQLNPLPHVTPK